jgi:hypothetical protein
LLIFWVLIFPCLLLSMLLFCGMLHCFWFVSWGFPPPVIFPLT